MTENLSQQEIDLQLAKLQEVLGEATGELEEVKAQRLSQERQIKIQKLKEELAELKAKIDSMPDDKEIVKETATGGEEIPEKGPTKEELAELDEEVRKCGMHGANGNISTYKAFLKSGLSYPDLQEKLEEIINKYKKNPKEVKEVKNVGGKNFNGINITTDKHATFKLTKKNEVEIVDKKKAFAGINNVLKDFYEWDEYPDNDSSSMIVIKKPIVSFNKEGEVSSVEKGKIIFNTEKN
ncbi:MAG: hypothetical protein V4439_02030 [Patescibacteria group bacterium]